MTASRPRPPLILALLLALSACAATTTAIGKRTLDVQTRMTESIFLEPVTTEKRTVLVEVRNSSDRPDLDIALAVRAAIALRGYRVVDDPKDAHFLLQTNILQVGRTSKTAAEGAFAKGFGSAVVGGAAGAGIGRAASDQSEVMIVGAVAGVAASAVADAFVQDVTYSIITDVQISERAGEGVMVTERMSQDLAQGSGGRRILSATEVHDWKRYQTRVMSSANQVNLDFEDAAPELTAGLTRAIAGIF
ncbi:MAG: complement resistance protein TraT [Geminicoccaceae bacterium]